ncbi:hypothetical protein [Aliikangiella maris]|uniref:Polymer-forming cytoskeletal protein n=2 Tax=Aliikangiella maris TaxID=3162458 RepID=A0ABV3MN27_9GAMM
MRTLNLNELNHVAGGSIGSNDVTNLSINGNIDTFAESVCDSGRVDQYSLSVEAKLDTKFLKGEIKGEVQIKCNTSNTKDTNTNTNPTSTDGGKKTDQKKG